VSKKELYSWVSLSELARNEHNLSHFQYIYEWSNHVYTNTGKQIWYQIPHSGCTAVLNAFLPGFMVAVAVNNEDNDHKFTFFPGVRLSGAKYVVVLIAVVVCSHRCLATTRQLYQLRVQQYCIAYMLV
jgi:hypothetical protein